MRIVEVLDRIFRLLDQICMEFDI